MTFFSKIFLFSAIICTLTSSAFERGRKIDVNGKEITIGNDRLSITVLPERAGRISSIFLKEGKIELLDPSKVSAVMETPLFSYTSDNMKGIYELLWKKKLNGTVGVDCTVANGKIIADGKYYGNVEVDLLREISLVPDALALEVKATFSNITASESEITPWIHIIGMPESTALIPLAAAPVHREGFGVLGKFPVPSLFTHGKHNNYLPPGTNWIAVKYTSKNLVWILRLPEGTLDKDGIFYSYGNGKGLQTSEVIWPKSIVKPQGKVAISYTIEIFPEMDNLNAVCGNTAVSFALKDGKLALKFCASRKENARKAVLICKDKAGTETQYAFNIPALAAGKGAQVTLPANAMPYTAKIIIDGKEYTVFF